MKQNSSSSIHTDVVIVGGGASGLAAAIELGMNPAGLDVTVIEKNSETGRKIRATGSGRCNITNTAAEGYPEIMDFFSRIGLVTRTYENGLVYPYSESAADVADLLETRARELGVRIITDAEVTNVSAERAAYTDIPNDNICADRNEDKYPAANERCDHCDRFRVTYRHKGKKSEEHISARYLILACGGKAGPMFGTTGDGYRLARGLGHSIVTPVPALTSVECGEWESDNNPCAVSLAGTRTRGTVTLYKQRPYDPDDIPAAGNTYRRSCDQKSSDSEKGNGTAAYSETGEIQFTKYGISGICVFNLTRHMRYDRSAGESLGDFVIEADLYPDGDIEKHLTERRTSAFSGEKTGDVLRTILKKNIASYVIATAGSSLIDRDTADLTDDEIRNIAAAAHRLKFHPVMLRGWKEAQVTSGGVSMKEIDPDTCESRLVRGLYITGELADRDFDCGGFNLSNAWVTGLRAAVAVIDR